MPRQVTFTKEGDKKAIQHQMTRKKYESMHRSQKNQNIKQKMQATSALLFQESQEKLRILEKEKELKR